MPDSTQPARRPVRPRALAALAAALALPACRSAPPAEPGPLELPALTADGRLFAGTSLRGAPSSEVELDADPARALRVRVSIVALERMPPVAWTPLSTNARFVADLLGPDPLVGAAEHFVGARFADGAEAARALESWTAGGEGRSARVAELDDTLPRGATAALGIAGAERVEDPLDWLGEHPAGPPVQKELQVLVGNAPGGARVAFVVEDVEAGWWRPAEEERTVAALAAAASASAAAGEKPARPRIPTDAAEPAPGPPEAREEPAGPGRAGSAPAPPSAAERRVLRREIVLLDAAPAVGEGPLVVLVPSMFAAGEARAFACVIEVEAAELAGADLDALAERTAELRAAAEARAGAEPYTEVELALLKRTSALEALTAESTRRAALVYCTQVLRAPLVDDLALAATDALLADYAAALLPSFHGFGDDALAALLEDDRTLAWRFESAAYRLLARRAMRADLDPELRALLLRHAGEAGSFPTALEDAVAASASVADLDRRFAEENRIFLEDSSPSARVRAYDWLALRGLAPAGYDPLADRDARRAALRDAETDEPAPEEPR